MTAATLRVKRELSSRPLAGTPGCCLLAEAGAVLRLAGEMRQSRHGPVLEAEFDNVAAVSRLRMAIAAATACPVRLRVLKPGGERAGVRYLLTAGPGPAAEGLARRTELTIGGLPVSGMPRPAVTGRRCDQLAAWRGAFLAAGSVSDPARSRTALIVACPTEEAALALAGAARRAGSDARTQHNDGASRVIIKDPEAITRLLQRIGAPGAAAEWEAVHQAYAARPRPGEAQLAVSLDAANRARSRSAAAAAAARAQRALEILGDDVPADLAAAAQLRISHPQASLSELGRLASPQQTRHTMAGRLRHLFRRADARAGALSDRGTEGAANAAAP